MNDDERRIFRHTATLENGASFACTRHAGLAHVQPLTPAAVAWLDEHVSDEDVIRHGDAVVCEMRFFSFLADAIMAAGFTFLRDELPN